MHTGSHRWLAWAAAAYTLFFVYGSLVPLNWQAQAVADVWQRLQALPGPQWPRAERVDAAVNFLLPLPLAFVLAHLLTRARWAGWLAWPLLALLSLGTEFAQAFFPPRDPSWSDVVAQWAGSAVGVLLFLFLGSRFDRWLAGLAGDQPAATRRTQLLGVYLAAMVAYNLMPLDLSLSPVELWRKWRDGRVLLLPFAATLPTAFDAVYALLSDVVLWLPVGLLWRIDGRGRSLQAIVGRGLAAAALIEIAQLAVLSRVSDVTDILLAGAGVALGASLPAAVRGWAGWTAARQRRWLVAAWVVWLVAMSVVMWWPFDFVLPAAGWQAAAAAVTRVPFENYVSRGEFAALGEIVRKLLLFVPGSMLLAALAQRRYPPASALPTLGALAGVALFLESGQLLLPGRIADLTDVALGCAGAAAGWLISGRLSAVTGPRTSAALAAVTAPQVVDRKRQTPPPAAGPRWPARQSMGAVGPAPWRAQLVLLAALAVVLWVAARLPGVPYNVAKLMPAGAHGGLSALGVAAAAGWMLAAPLWLLQPQRRGARALFVLWAVLHGLVSFGVLRATVPLPMLHKIIGVPVLGWAGPWEDIGRYLALHVSVMLPLFGGALLACAAWRAQAVVDLLNWLIAVLLLAWPLHWVVVERAATDNLTELMRGGGGFGASVSIAAGLWLLAAAGSAVALAAVQVQRRRALLLLAATAAAASPVLLWLGLEPAVVKYGQVFSAVQFIVSAGRDAYAGGVDLAQRAGLALGGALASVALLQALMWRWLAAAGPRAAAAVQPGRGPVPAP